MLDMKEVSGAVEQAPAEDTIDDYDDIRQGLQVSASWS